MGLSLLTVIKRVGILHLIVHPDHQRQGYGSAILSKLCREMDTHEAYGIATTPSDLVQWYRKFGFEVIARMKSPFDDLRVVVRKPADVGDFQVPAPDCPAPGRLGILGDAASRAKDYALGLAYELLIPELMQVTGTRSKRFAKHEGQLEEEETDPLLKLFGVGKGLPGKRVYDRYAERAWDQLAKVTSHDLIVFTTFSNTAGGEPAESRVEWPVEAGHDTERPEPTNVHVEQSGSANGPAEDSAKPPEPADDGHVEQSGPGEEQAEQPTPGEAHAEETEPVQQLKKKYIATPRRDRKKRPTRKN